MLMSRNFSLQTKICFCCALINCKIAMVSFKNAKFAFRLVFKWIILLSFYFNAISSVSATKTIEFRNFSLILNSRIKMADERNHGGRSSSPVRKTCPPDIRLPMFDGGIMADLEGCQGKGTASIESYSCAVAIVADYWLYIVQL
jgi:hypothetical protein